MSSITHIGRAGSTRRLRRSRAGRLHDALEARLIALNPHGASTPPSAAPGLGSSTPLRNLSDTIAGLGVVALAGVLLLALVVLRGDGVFERDGASPARSFSVSRDGGGRVSLPAVEGEAVVRVAMEPKVTGATAWFWCVDAEPALPPEARICASAADSPSGAVTVERVVKFVPGRRYFLQTFCESDCHWRLEVPEATVSSASAGRLP
jgi:hypothetical protein